MNVGRLAVLYPYRLQTTAVQKHISWCREGRLVERKYHRETAMPRARPPQNKWPGVRSVEGVIFILRRTLYLHHGGRYYLQYRAQPFPCYRMTIFHKHMYSGILPWTNQALGTQKSCIELPSFLNWHSLYTSLQLQKNISVYSLVLTVPTPTPLSLHNCIHW